MKKPLSLVTILIITVAALSPISCSKGNTKNDGPKQVTDLSLARVDIERKYLTEGFISNDLYRVVIVTPKETGLYDMDAIQNRARKRAQVSIEKNLAEHDIQCDRNTRAEIINLINQNGQLSKKELDEQRYNVYYYEITKKNMKNYLKNIASHR